MASKKILVTLDPEIYEILEENAKINGLKLATRAAQLLTIAARNISAGKEITLHSTESAKEPEQVAAVNNTEQDKQIIKNNAKFKIT